MRIYVVERGDSVDTIAESQGIPVQNLIFDNQIGYPYRLAVGQALYIRDETPSEEGCLFMCSVMHTRSSLRIIWKILFHF